MERGVREPQTLEEWAAFHPRIQALPWLQGERHARIQRIRDYIRIGYSARQMVVEPPRGLKGLVRRGLRRLARWRLRSTLVQFPVEVWALRAWAAMKRAASPAVLN